MQGAHDWAKNLNKIFEGHVYYKSKADPQICLRVCKDKFTWTDNILDASSTIKDEVLAKFQLGASYEIKDLGEARFILGMCIDRDPQSGDIAISQKAYS